MIGCALSHRIASWAHRKVPLCSVMLQYGTDRDSVLGFASSKPSIQDLQGTAMSRKWLFKRDSNPPTQCAALHVLFISSGTKYLQTIPKFLKHPRPLLFIGSMGATTTKVIFWKHPMCSFTWILFSLPIYTLRLVFPMCVFHYYLPVYRGPQLLWYKLRPDLFSVYRTYF